MGLCGYFLLIRESKLRKRMFLIRRRGLQILLALLMIAIALVWTVKKDALGGGFALIGFSPTLITPADLKFIEVHERSLRLVSSLGTFTIPLIAVKKYDHIYIVTFYKTILLETAHYPF
jgi:hypothetical protein